MLKIKQISVRIAGITVLRNIDTEFSAGGLLAIVGRNGAGKTTLLRTVMGLIEPEQGTMEFDGRDLADIPAHGRVALGIGYAPEDRVMFPTFSVEENLRLPCEVLGLSKAEIDRRLEKALVVVPQLKEMLPRSGAALSGGQGKIAALGRALMAGTRLVLLDEPFQGLAPVLALQYGESLRRLREIDAGLCVVVTESNRSLLRDLPDATLTLERGELVPASL
ncbi:ATP-binding cassette domain-containing protein [Herbaspirillum sp. RTI4]|uniref:ABC transporter ATP-binding protein n=1 Tax=Herbaspirillum sp. RTI4 TaxID=3048640 RepID=UPI002AB55376|nr:ATP-binding cassette domain-containing protein [Herbaspirillum sp. RTI4]MDY7579139.1 ATP-binding cassette domain-containing protein [Herbaspirillum sp. RTI4]MEA9981282.1 ATP-binding cassette domain-containing protein [Herbaspirillum sp. RTI4]